jgi:hypothetical protein
MNAMKENQQKKPVVPSPPSDWHGMSAKDLIDSTADPLIHNFIRSKCVPDGDFQGGRSEKNYARMMAWEMIKGNKNPFNKLVFLFEKDFSKELTEPNQDGVLEVKIMDLLKEKRRKEVN